MTEPMRGIELRANLQDYGRNIGVRIASVDGHGDLSVVRDLVFVPVDSNEYTLPTFALSPEQAQQLIDELWRCGVRPTEGSGSAGSLAATERHLKDMQTVAFSLLDGEQVMAKMARERGVKR